MMAERHDGPRTRARARACWREGVDDEAGALSLTHTRAHSRIHAHTYAHMLRHSCSAALKRPTLYSHADVLTLVGCLLKYPIMPELSRCCDAQKYAFN
jgi:hypothetical protein